MATRKASTTARGLGWRHQQQVAALKRRHRDGAPCWWCGEPMYLSQALAGDHTVPRAHGGQLADRLLHSDCNSQRGDGTHDDERPAITGRRAGRQRHGADDLGVRVMPWP